MEIGQPGDVAVISTVVGLDPRRPWPGVARDPSARDRGLDSLLGDGWREHDAAVVLEPAALTMAADPGEVVAGLLDRLPVGGHVVSEEPGPGSTAELEPLMVDGNQAALVSVVRQDDPGGSTVLDVALMRFEGSPGEAADVSVERARVAPMTIDEHDAIAAVNGFELVARWSDWSGRPADDGWRISIHRRMA